MTATGDQLEQQLAQLDPSLPSYAMDAVERLLTAARAVRASDIHLQPTADGLEIRWRLDGVLQRVGQFPRGDAADIVARLKVLAELLTYRTDVPQEGRIRGVVDGVEIRVSTFPTLFGERAVVRLFGGARQFRYIADLGFPADLDAALHAMISETSGALIVSGPAGSGKTTTAYACLRELVRRTEGGTSIVSLEDPVEVAVEGVAQSQIQPQIGFDLASGLRSLMRQDPEVILVGEIRDRETSEAVFQACLTGHLVISTFHAGNAAEAICRLADMGIEPYQLRSGLRGILNQRLVRQLCDCKQPITSAEEMLGFEVAHAWQTGGCTECLGTGYIGRAVIAEWLPGDAAGLSSEVLAGRDARRIHQCAVETGMVTLAHRAQAAVAGGVTSPREIRRVLGFRAAPADGHP